MPSHRRSVSIPDRSLVAPSRSVRTITRRSTVSTRAFAAASRRAAVTARLQQALAKVAEPVAQRLDRILVVLEQEVSGVDEVGVVVVLDLTRRRSASCTASPRAATRGPASRPSSSTYENSSCASSAAAVSSRSRRGQQVLEALELVQDDQVRLQRIEAGPGQQVAQVTHEPVALPRSRSSASPTSWRGSAEDLDQFVEAFRIAVRPSATVVVALATTSGSCRSARDRCCASAPRALDRYRGLNRRSVAHAALEDAVRALAADDGSVPSTSLEHHPQDHALSGLSTAALEVERCAGRERHDVDGLRPGRWPSTGSIVSRSATSRWPSPCVCSRRMFCLAICAFEQT